MGWVLGVDGRVYDSGTGREDYLIIEVCVCVCLQGGGVGSH